MRTDRAHEMRPCARCGIGVRYNVSRSKGYSVCRDCRQSDPEWLKAVEQGVRVA